MEREHRDTEEGVRRDDADLLVDSDQEQLTSKEMRERVVQSGIEYCKTEYDALKHFTTLNLATLAALTAILSSGILPRAIFEPPYENRTKVAIVLSYAVFLLSLRFAVAGMIGASRALWMMRLVKSEDDFLDLPYVRSHKWRWRACLFFFFGGYGGFAIVFAGYILFP